MNPISFFYNLIIFMIVASSCCVVNADNCDSAWIFYRDKIDDKTLDDSETGRSKREQILIELAKSCKDDRTIDKLSYMLLHDNNYSIRAAAAMGLGIIGDKKAAKVLYIALGDAFVYVRLEAAQALSFLKKADTSIVIDTLVSIAKGNGKENWCKNDECDCNKIGKHEKNNRISQWRIYAMNILTGINKKEARIVTTQLTKDKNEKVRSQAKKLAKHLDEGK